MPKYYVTFIVITMYLFTVGKTKVFHNFRQVKPIKVNQKWKSHMYVQKHKYYFLYINILLKSENYHADLFGGYVLHNLQGQFSGTQVFIFVLKSAGESIVLYSFGTRFHNLGPR